MKIVPTTDESGEELEEFVPVEDQKLEAKLMEIATLKLNDDEQADDEDSMSISELTRPIIRFIGQNLFDVWN